MKILIFDSIHYVMKAESILKNKNIKIELIPVPKEIHSNCGMAIAIANKLFNKAKEELLKKGIKFKTYYYNKEIDFYFEEKL